MDKFPPILHSEISVLLFVFLVVIIGLSLWQFVRARFIGKLDELRYFRSVVPLGWASMAFGFVGMFVGYSQAFADIEAAGDISPSIVASAMKQSFNYPVLGFTCLGTSYVFRFVNQIILNREV